MISVKKIFQILIHLAITLSTVVAFVCYYLFFEFYISNDFSKNDPSYNPIEQTTHSSNTFVYGLMGIVFNIPLMIWIFFKLKKKSK